MNIKKQRTIIEHNAIIMKNKFLIFKCSNNCQYNSVETKSLQLQLLDADESTHMDASMQIKFKN